MTLLSPGDVAKRLKLSTSRVIQLDREGALRAIRDSAGRRLYEHDVVEHFAQERDRYCSPLTGSRRACVGTSRTARKRKVRNLRTRLDPKTT
jgi:MerR family regulatory protein